MDYHYDTDLLNSQFTQNGVGRLTGVTFGGYSANIGIWLGYRYMYSYTPSGHVTSQQMTVTKYLNGPVRLVQFTAGYQWDNEGRMTSMQYPTVVAPYQNLWTPPVAAYQYDANGRMNGMTMDYGWGPQSIAGATYGPAGELLTLAYGTGTETRTYNSMLQLTHQVVPGYLDMTYNYSSTQNNGRITGSVDANTGENVSYGYDVWNRLTSATASGMWGETYGYDGFGNLTSKSGSGGAPSMTAQFDAQNHETSNGASYDANGSMTSGVNTANQWDLENRLKIQQSYTWPSPRSAFQYDPSGKRVMKWVDTDPSDEMDSEYQSFEFNFYGITGQRLVTVGCPGPTSEPWTTLPDCYLKGQNVYFGGKQLISNGARW